MYEIYVAVVVLAIAALLALFAKAKSFAIGLIPLAGLAVVFVQAGTVLGENPRLHYAWLAVSVSVVIIHVLRKTEAA